MTVIARSEATKQSSLLTLTLPLTEVRGFSPRTIYGRRSLPSKKDLKIFKILKILKTLILTAPK